MTKTVETTIVPAALANGAEGKGSVHSRRSLDAQRGRTKSSAAMQVATADTVVPAPAPKAKKAAAPKAPAAPKGEAKGIINGAGRIVLKANKEVRAVLKAAAKLAGGSRLDAQGFDSFSAFLNGFAANDGGKRQTTINFKVVGTDAKVKLVVATDGSWIVQ